MEVVELESFSLQDLRVMGRIFGNLGILSLLGRLLNTQSAAVPVTNPWSADLD